GIARFDFVFLDVNRGVVIVLYQLFADENSVFKVVAAPWHKGHQYVAAKSQFTAVSARTVRKNLLFLYAIAYANQRLLVDTSVLVGTLELGQCVDVCSNFAAQYAGVVGLDTNNDAFGIDLVDDAIAFAEHNRARIASGNTLHARTDERSLTTNERHALTLHVRTHQRAIGVIVFKKWNQAG